MTAVRVQKPDRAEIGRQYGAVLLALDELFGLEVPRGPAPKLRLVRSFGEAVDRDHVGESLRAIIIRRGEDLFAIGGQLGLFAAVRAVMAARPDRQRWNNHALSALWAGIGAEAPVGARLVR
jgi:hypothetical protein